MHIRIQPLSMEPESVTVPLESCLIRNSLKLEASLASWDLTKYSFPGFIR